MISKKDIGKRVSIKTKPGVGATLRFVGKVAFKPPSHPPWAGVELDKPLGKSDGQVKGKRYFRCKAMHGSMLPVKNVSLMTDIDKTVENNRNLVLATGDDAYPNDDWVGKPVQVEGKGQGVLKFLGPVQYSKKNPWAGVDLDEPLGKNDGAVKGKRYFRAKKNHGTMVPLISGKIIRLVPREAISTPSPTIEVSSRESENMKNKIISRWQRLEKKTKLENLKNEIDTLNKSLKAAIDARQELETENTKMAAKLDAADAHGAMLGAKIDALIKQSTVLLEAQRINTTRAAGNKDFAARSSMSIEQVKMIKDLFESMKNVQEKHTKQYIDHLVAEKNKAEIREQEYRQKLEVSMNGRSADPQEHLNNYENHNYPNFSDNAISVTKPSFINTLEENSIKDMRVCKSANVSRKKNSCNIHALTQQSETEENILKLKDAHNEKFQKSESGIYSTSGDVTMANHLSPVTNVNPKTIPFSSKPSLQGEKSQSLPLNSENISTTQCTKNMRDKAIKVASDKKMQETESCTYMRHEQNISTRQEEPVFTAETFNHGSYEKVNNSNSTNSFQDTTAPKKDLRRDDMKAQLGMTIEEDNSEKRAECDHKENDFYEFESNFQDADSKIITKAGDIKENTSSRSAPIDMLNVKETNAISNTTDLGNSAQQNNPFCSSLPVTSSEVLSKDNLQIITEINTAVGHNQNHENVNASTPQSIKVVDLSEKAISQIHLGIERSKAQAVEAEINFQIEATEKKIKDTRGKNICQNYQKGIFC